MKSIMGFGISIIQDIEVGDSIADHIINNLGECQIEDNDIIVVTHKIVSKAEGREILLDSIEVSERALAYAKLLNKPSEYIQLMLNESKSVIWAQAGGPFLLEHNSGVACANAGVDLSNCKKGYAICLPVDSDKSANEIKMEIMRKLGKKVAVAICDSQGRPFRNGSIGVLLGSSGMLRLKSYIGSIDRNNRVMRTSIEAIGDEISSMANLIMGQASESMPVVVIRGLQNLVAEDNSPVTRNPDSDIFIREVREKNNEK